MLITSHSFSYSITSIFPTPASSWARHWLGTTKIILLVINLTVVTRYANHTGITLPENFEDDFDSNEAAVLFNRMKMCFHVAGSISPLVIFIPTRWTNASLSRGHLLTVLAMFFISYISFTLLCRSCTLWEH